MPRWDVHFNMYVRVEDPEVVRLTARAMALASVIRGIPLPPYVQDRIDRLNIMRAVRGTTGIEGTDLTEEEVREVLQAPPTEPVLSGGREREEREVRNAANLMDEVAAYLDQRPSATLTEDTVRWLHRMVTEGIDYPGNVPGGYRARSVNAGDYQCPEHTLVPGLMAEFTRWFNAGPPQHWDPVVRAVVAHFYVVSIHPFADGNGRTSRAVESYLLYQSGVNARGFYSLANYYYRNRPEYIEQLNQARFRFDPDLTPFVRFALVGLVEELELVHGEVIDEVRAIAFRDYSREQLGFDKKIGRPVGERLMALLIGLSRAPVTLKELREGRHSLSRLYRGVTTKTLTRDIHYLEEAGLVVVADGVICANLAAMDDFTAQPAQPQPYPMPRRLL